MSEAEYLEVGVKKAEMFKNSRSVIYKLFLKYMALKKDKFGYDLMDVVKNIYDKFKNHGYQGVPFHNVTSTFSQRRF